MYHLFDIFYYPYCNFIAIYINIITEQIFHTHRA